MMIRYLITVLLLILTATLLSKPTIDKRELAISCATRECVISNCHDIDSMAISEDSKIAYFLKVRQSTNISLETCEMFKWNIVTGHIKSTGVKYHRNRKRSNNSILIDSKNEFILISEGSYLVCRDSENYKVKWKNKIGYIRHMLLSRDGTHVYTAADAGIIMYDVKNGKNILVRNYTPPNIPKCDWPVLFAGEGNIVAFREDRDIIVMKMQERHLEFPHHKTVGEIGIHKMFTGISMGTGKHLMYAVTKNGLVNALSVANIGGLTPVYNLYTSIPGAKSMSRIHISPDESTMIVSNHDYSDNIVMKKHDLQWKAVQYSAIDGCILGIYALDNNRIGIITRINSEKCKIVIRQTGVSANDGEEKGRKGGEEKGMSPNAINRSGKSVWVE